jgi:hypothetical protein
MAQDNFLQPKKTDNSRVASSSSNEKHTIIFRDQSGTLKMIKDGKIVDAPSQQSLKVNATEPENNSVVNQFSEKINRIIKKSHIHFTDDAVERRFRMIIESRLRNIRNNIQVKELFLDELENGGMEFDEETAGEMMKLINEEMGEVKAVAPKTETVERKMVFKPENKPVMNSGDVIFLKKVAPKPLLPQVTSQEKKTEKPIINPVIKSSQIKLEQQAVITQPKPLVNSQAGKKKEVLLSKPVMQDISFEPKLTGPLEELQDLTIIDFQRLGQTGEQRVNKVMEKINILEKDSFALKLQGIDAWKRSEVYKQYLEMAQASIEQKKPLNDIVEAFSKQKKQSLTMEDVEAIIGLSDNLRRL